MPELRPGGIVLLREALSEMVHKLVDFASGAGRVAEKPMRDVADQLHTVTEMSETDAESAQHIRWDDSRD
jgi:hypothetical protein